MKLLRCKVCHDCVMMHPGWTRTCLCKKSWGKYVGEGIEVRGKLYWDHVKVGGEGEAFGIDNYTFGQAELNLGQFFVGWFYKPGGDINTKHIHYEEVEDGS